MINERFFIDTVFIQALLNSYDQYHTKAKAFLPRLRKASEVWITEAILVEVCNAFSAINRIVPIQFVEYCYSTDNIQVVTIDTPLLMRAITLYKNRSDKMWGLTDCISFVVMDEQGLMEAVTADKHFVQAGYRALLLE